MFVIRPVTNSVPNMIYGFYGNVKECLSMFGKGSDDEPHSFFKRPPKSSNFAAQDQYKVFVTNNSCGFENYVHYSEEFFLGLTMPNANFIMGN